LQGDLLNFQVWDKKAIDKVETADILNYHDRVTGNSGVCVRQTPTEAGRRAIVTGFAGVVFSRKPREFHFLPKAWQPVEKGEN